MNEHVLLAKQPIYNHDLTLYAFELLFRRENQPLNVADLDEDAATSEVLVNFSTSISNEIDNSSNLLFVNVSETFLLSDTVLPIDHSRIVFEILERVKVTDELVQKVAELHSKGYRFALDDYDGDPKFDPLIQYCEIIKVDVLNLKMDEVVAIKNKVSKSYNGKWLAEKIEDRDMLGQCIEIGFTLFQGYMLAKPKALLGNTIRGSSGVTAEIVRLTCSPESDINEITERVSQDPQLSMQLLKLINSPLVNLNKPVADLKQAITFLGTDNLKSWAMMMAFVSNEQSNLESSRIVLTRAKCCELFFNASKNPKAKEYAPSAFLVGLISGVDLLLEVEPSFFVRQIKFTPEIEEAILSNNNPLSKAVSQIKALEFILAQSLEKIQNIPKALLAHYSDAQMWAAQVVDSLD